MLASSARPTRPQLGWVEPKLDGWRARLGVTGDGFWVRTRQDKTLTLPALGALAARLPPGTLLDGELIADHGRVADFGLLSAAIAGRPSAPPLVFAAFDCLVLGYEPIVTAPLEHRRQHLEQLPVAGPAGALVPQWAGNDIDALLDACCTQGMEGVVWKSAGSPYLPGKRTRSWLKVKCPAWMANRTTGWGRARH